VTIFKKTIGFPKDALLREVCVSQEIIMLT
jgi:hypothetical protein